MEVCNINIWDAYDAGHLIAITTNGTVKKDGSAVLGAGVAKQATERFPWLPSALGDHIRHSGNVLGRFGDIYTFPVKHNWYEAADLSLIKNSYLDLVASLQGDTIFLPKPGCGNGKLKWKDVAFVLQPIAESNIIIVDYKI